MKLTLLSIFAILARCAAASQTLTGQWTCVDSGAYELCQNLWGEDNGTGSQNATLYSASGDSISWSTTYTWSGGQYDVKSYSSVNQLSANGMLLSDITSAPTSWDWEYQEISSDLVADVSYDIWVGTTPDDPGSNTTTFEIMIWVSTEGGEMPAVPVHWARKSASDISVGGYTWNLYEGPNTYWETISFVTTEGNLNNFSSDLKDFFDYLVANYGVSDSDYLQAVESGTEPFTGSATLYTSNFHVVVNI